MDDNKKNRKSSRNFSLEKKEDRRSHFNLEKEDSISIPQKSQVSNQDKTNPLSKPVFEGKTTVTSASKREGSDSTKGTEKRSKWWLWLLLLLAIVMVLIIIFRKGTDKDIESNDNEPIAVMTDSPENIDDSITTLEPVTEEEKTDIHQEDLNPVATTNATQQSSPASPDNPYANSQVDGTVEDIAKEVIRGEYGVGMDRKTALGDRYTEVQNRVNEIYREKGLL